MAQGDLYKLLTKVSKALANDMDSKGKGSERFRDRIDKYPHDVYINRDSIRDEILIQLNDFKLADSTNTIQYARRQFGSASGNTREQASIGVQSLATKEGFSASQLKVIEEQADLFVRDALNAKPPRGIKISKISGDNKNFVLRFTPTTKGSSVYDAINKSIFQPAKARLAKQLNDKGFPIDSSKEKRLFNVGHINAVSTLKATRALSAINLGTDRILKKYTDPIANEAADVLRLNITSKFSRFGNPEFAKDLLIKAASVKPESEATNLTDSDYEAALLRDVRKSIEKTLASLPNDWARQRSSDSIIDILAKEMLEVAAKSGKGLNAKFPSLGKKDNSNNSSGTVEIKLKKEKINPTVETLASFGGLQLPQTNSTPTTSAVSLTNLIPILNESLPQFVRARMGQEGRLVNRTGRLSESAQVISIDDSNNTVGYTYQLYPYSKFEKDPAKDPRKLIEMAIRDKAKGIMSDKFSLRRL